MIVVDVGRGPDAGAEQVSLPDEQQARDRASEQHGRGDPEQLVQAGHEGSPGRLAGLRRSGPGSWQSAWPMPPEETAALSRSSSGFPTAGIGRRAPR